jgi:hypothetical protein
MTPLLSEDIIAVFRLKSVSEHVCIYGVAVCKVLLPHLVKCPRANKQTGVQLLGLDDLRDPIL